jgi:hypothetical protein
LYQISKAASPFEKERPTASLQSAQVLGGNAQGSAQHEPAGYLSEESPTGVDAKACGQQGKDEAE